MNSQAGRIKELQEKERLSDGGFTELQSLSPPGMYLALPHLNVAGIVDFDKALGNLLVIGKLITKATDSGYYVEAIALRSQAAELFLRLFIGATNPGRTPLDAGDRRTLGVLVDEAERRGLDAPVVARLREFNASRIAGIHRLLLGGATYESLQALCTSSDGMLPALLTAIGSHETLKK